MIVSGSISGITAFLHHENELHEIELVKAEQIGLDIAIPNEKSFEHWKYNAAVAVKAN